MTRVEKLIPQIVEEVIPDEKEDVDAHPDHLQTQPGSCFHHKTSLSLKINVILSSLFALKMQEFGHFCGVLRTKPVRKFSLFSPLVLFAL